MKNIILRLAAVTSLTLLTPALSHGQTRNPAFPVSPTLDDVGIETGASLLGFYIAPSYDINENAQIRVLLSAGNLSSTQDIDGSNITGTLSTRSTSLLVDYYPFDNGFRLSGGFTNGGYTMTASVNDLTLGDVNFSGTLLNLTLAEKNAISPVISLGFESSSSGFAIVSDLGLRFDSLKLSVSGQENLTNLAQFETELATYNNELANVKVLPVFNIGIAYSF